MKNWANYLRQLPFHKNALGIQAVSFSIGQALYVVQKLRLAAQFATHQWIKPQADTLSSIHHIKDYFRALLLFSLQLYFDMIPLLTQIKMLGDACKLPASLSINVGKMKQKQYLANKDFHQNIPTPEKNKIFINPSFEKPTALQIELNHLKPKSMTESFREYAERFLIGLLLIYHATELVNGFKKLWVSPLKATSIVNKTISLLCLYFKSMFHMAQIKTMTKIILTKSFPATLTQHQQHHTGILYFYSIHRATQIWTGLKTLIAAPGDINHIIDNNADLSPASRVVTKTPKISPNIPPLNSPLTESTHTAQESYQSEVEYQIPIIPNLERTCTFEKVNLSVEHANLQALLKNINSNTEELILRKSGINLLSLPQLKEIFQTISDLKNPITKLDLSENELGLASEAYITVLANFINSNKTIKILIFSENKIHKLSATSFEKLFNAILENSSISYLDISFNKIGLLKNKQLSDLSQYLTQSKVLQLNIARNDLARLSIDVFKNLMLCLSNHPTLTFLDLSGNQVHKLDMAKHSCLAELIKTTRILLHLILANNNLGEAPKELSSILFASMKNSTLQTVNLSWNNMDRLDVHSIYNLRSFISHSARRAIDLRGNSIAVLHKKSFQKLISCMSNRSITTWNLADNQIGELSKKRLKKWAAYFIKHTKLLDLNLAGNSLGKVCSLSFRKIIAVIVANTELLTLNLSDNCLNCQTPADLALLFKAISSHPSLKSVNLANNNIGQLQDGPLTDLTDIIVKKSDLEYFDISGNGFKNHPEFITSIKTVVTQQLSLIELTYDDTSFDESINDKFKHRYTFITNYFINDLKIVSAMCPLIIQYLGERKINAHLSFVVKNPNIKRERSKSTTATSILATPPMNIVPSEIHLLMPPIQRNSTEPSHQTKAQSRKQQCR